MRTHTQLKGLIAGVVIALATLSIMITPVQKMIAGQAKTPMVTLPVDANQSGLALHVVQPKGNNSERAAVNRLQIGRIDRAQATTPGALSFLPAVTYYSGAWDAFSVAVEIGRAHV